MSTALEQMTEFDVFTHFANNVIDLSHTNQYDLNLKQIKGGYYNLIQIKCGYYNLLQIKGGYVT